MFSNLSMILFSVSVIQSSIAQSALVNGHSSDNRGSHYIRYPLTQPCPAHSHSGLWTSNDSITIKGLFKNHATELSHRDPTVSKIEFSEKLARDRMMISVSYKEKPTQ